MRHKIACLYVRPSDKHVLLFLSPSYGRLSPAFLNPHIPSEVLDTMKKVGVIEFRKGNDAQHFHTITYYIASPSDGIDYLDRSLIGPMWYDLRNPTCMESISENDMSEVDKAILPMLLDVEHTPIQGWVKLCTKIPNKVIDKHIHYTPPDLVSP